MVCLETPQTKALGLSGLPGLFNSAAVSDFTEQANFKLLPLRKCDFLALYLTLDFQGFKQEFSLWQMHKQFCRCNIPTCSLEEHHCTVLDIRTALGWWFFWGLLQSLVGWLLWGFCLGFFLIIILLQLYNCLSPCLQHHQHGITFKISQIIILGRKKGQTPKITKNIALKKKQTTKPQLTKKKTQKTN